ncbi:MAG: thiamine-phosphate kinase [Methyloprofundus sp.]|nr:thiamine-phosphate kinase [Methyloprofundus sp.]
MAITEFDIIQKYFTRPARHKNTQLSVGDDCALLSVPEGYDLAITTDTMVEGVHFFSDVESEYLGHKLLAVNLSDLASMGAEPVAVTLALTLPEVDLVWLQGFAKGMFALADKHAIDLVGGDTTSGPLTLTIQAMGVVPKGRALKRSAAQVGDLVYVTGSIGDAGLGLKIKQGYSCVDGIYALQRFNLPDPRIDEGLVLCDLANACVDISDGLAADLGHILNQSGVGACLDYQQLPVSTAVREYMDKTKDWQLPLVAGDDYELCFSISPDKAGQLNIACTCIGVIEAEKGLRLKRDGVESKFLAGGFEHFT